MPAIVDMIKCGLAAAAQARDRAAFESWFDALVEEITIDAIERVIEPCPN